MHNDSTCKRTLSLGLSFKKFWCKKALLYPKRRGDLRCLVMFSRSCLCEYGFLALLLMKNKSKNS